MNALEFMDCPQCNKRIRTSASKCHRCGYLLSTSHDKASATRPPASKAKSSSETEAPEASAAQSASFGGYNAEDDEFQYDEFIENEFGPPKRKGRFTRRITWLLIFAMTLPIFIWLVEIFVL